VSHPWKMLTSRLSQSCSLVAACLTIAVTALYAGPVAADTSEADARPVVRLGVVNTPQDSGLLAALLPDFEAQSGYRVEVFQGGDLYERASAGEADLLISHYGKGAVEKFVMSGLGLWPRPVFASRRVLVGPVDDPAGVHGLRDPFEAMRRIAAAEAPLVLGKSVGVRYLADMLLAGAGDPERGAWFELTELSGAALVAHARERSGYTVLAASGFAQLGDQRAGMQVMLDDPALLHRIMAIVRVNPEKIEGVNVAGAKALEAYLLSAGVQASIANFREPASGHALWASAARHNHSKWLVRAGD
jgi:tungstate transport system substrate-binding protein